MDKIIIIYLINIIEKVKYNNTTFIKQMWTQYYKNNLKKNNYFSPFHMDIVHTLRV